MMPRDRRARLAAAVCEGKSFSETRCEEAEENEPPELESFSTLQEFKNTDNERQVSLLLLAVVLASDLALLLAGDEGGFESGGRFLGLTDATPLKSKCPGDHRMTFLPFPDFSPGMVRLRLEPGRDGKGAMEMDSAIPLPLTSTPPRSTGGSEEFLNSTFWGPEDENDAEERRRATYPGARRRLRRFGRVWASKF